MNPTPAGTAMNWTPLTEAMPDLFVPVLAHNATAQWTYVACRIKDDMFQDATWSSFLIPTHWCPLPDAPERTEL